jgi:hypothetical protein
MNTRSLRDNLALYFQQHANVWIDGVTLEMIAGRYAWRSRVSDCRTELGMVIENRQRRQTDETGKRWTTSEYLYRPTEEDDLTRSAELAVDPSPQHASTDGRLW